MEALRRLSYDVALDNARVTPEVFDLQGRRVRVLIDEAKRRGSYTVQWDGRDERGNELPSGAYFYRATIGRFSDTKKMIMLR